MTVSTDDTALLHSEVAHLLDHPEQLRSHWVIDWDRLPARKARRLRVWYRDRSQAVPAAKPLLVGAAALAVVALLAWVQNQPFLHVVLSAVTVAVAGVLAVVAARLRRPREWAETTIDRYHAELQIGEKSVEVAALVQVAQDYAERLHRWAPVTWDRQQRRTRGEHRRQAGMLNYVGLSVDTDVRLEQIKRAALEAEREESGKTDPDYADLYAMVAAFCRYCHEVQSLQMAVNAVEREAAAQRAEAERVEPTPANQSVLLSTERDIIARDAVVPDESGSIVVPDVKS